MLLPALQLFDDRTSLRTAAEQMAMDEALLATAVQPVLRVYRWSAPVLSFGYFLAHSDVRREALAGEQIMRRWTGGGMVHHHLDFPWSLIIPRSAEALLPAPRRAYADVHAALAAAMASAGTTTRQIDADASAPSGGLCFTAPAPGDLISPEGGKLAGAGQRRTRQGLLHQGTVQGVTLPPDFPEVLASRLGRSVAPFQPQKSLNEAAAELAAARYALPGWLTLR